MKKYLVFFLFFFHAFYSNAMHIRGGVITYEHISAKKYTIYVDVWRDCSGTPLSASNVYIYNDTFGIMATISTGSQTKIGYKDISLYDTSSACGASYRCIGGTLSGFEEHTYKMTFDFANYSGCEFYITWNQQSRSTAATTGSANENFFMDAYINLCYDSLPRSIRKKGPPDLLMIHNRDKSFNPGMYDGNDYFDSVSYSLVEALKSLNTSVTYTGSYSPQRPLAFFGFPNQNLNWPAGFHLDPMQGTVRFRPTTNNQIGPIAIMLKGWKEVNDTMRLVGYTRYDFSPSIVTNQGLASDYLYGPGNGLRYVCLNQTRCFETQFVNETSDTMKLSYFVDRSDMVVDTLQWQPDSIRLRVCITPDTSYSTSKVYRIVADARAKLCPYYVRGVYSEGFLVIPAPDSNQYPSWSDTRDCNQLKIVVSDTAASGKSCYVKVDTGTYAKDSILINLQQFDTGWFKYQVMQDWLGCQVVFEDSIFIDSLYHFSNATVLPIKACANEQLVLRAKGSGGLGIESILWGDSSSIDSFSIFIDRDTTVAMRMVDSSGCYAVDTFTIRMNPAISGSAHDVAICTELPNTAVTLSAATTGGTAPYVYHWIGLDSGNNVSFTPPMVDTAIVFELIDSVNCRLYDTLDIDRYIPHYPDAAGDTTGCYIGAVYIYPKNKVSSGTYYWLGMVTGDSLRYYPSLGSNQRIVRYTDTLGCITYDTVHMQNNPNPNFYLPGDTAVCAGTSLRIDPTIISGKRPFVYEWLPYSTLSDSFVQDVFYQSARIHLKITDSNSCYREDFMDVLVSTIPQISAQSPYSHCTHDSLLSLDGISGSINGVWKGNRVIQLNGAYWFDTRGLVPGSHFISFEIQGVSGGCSAKEDLEIILHESPLVDAGLDTGLCGGGALVFRAIPNGGTQPYSYVWNGDTSQTLDSMTHFLTTDTVFYVAINDSNGCSYSDSVHAFFYSIPQPQILTPSQDTGLCAGNNSLFIEGDTSSKGGSIQFQFNYGLQNGSTLVPDSSFTLRYEAISNEGCWAIDSLRVALNVNPVISSIQSLSVCEDAGNIVLDSMASPLGGGWIGSGVWTDSVSFYFNPDSSGLGQFALTYLLIDTSTGCYDTTSTFSSVEEKTMVYFSADSTWGIAPMTSTFQDSSIGGLQLNYLWYFGDGDSSASMQPSHVYGIPGFYSVELRVSGIECTSSALKANYIRVDTNTTGLIHQEMDGFELFPNPGKGHFYVRGFPQGTQFKVYDALGREVQFHFQPLSDSYGEIKLNHTVPGTYMLEGISVQGRVMRSFVVE